MTERNKPHNGRDLDGNYRVRKADVDELLESPEGVDFVRDDVRLGGAVEDTGLHAGESGTKIERLIEDNARDVARVTEPSRESRIAKPGEEKAKKKGFRMPWN